jgi:AhpD family alkylhydroperoxidase
MTQRFNTEKDAPEAYKAMYGMVASLNKISITPIQKELIKIRASQINCCAFCINMHTKEALKIGETPQRIFLISAWRETDVFTEEEKAILLFTEEVTLIHKEGVSDSTYQLMEKFFSVQTIAEILMSVVLINSWNRIAVTSRLPLGA